MIPLKSYYFWLYFTSLDAFFVIFISVETYSMIISTGFLGFTKKDPLKEKKFFVDRQKKQVSDSTWQKEVE